MTSLPEKRKIRACRHGFLSQLSPEAMKKRLDYLAKKESVEELFKNFPMRKLIKLEKLLRTTEGVNALRRGIRDAYDASTPLTKDKKVPIRKPR